MTGRSAFRVAARLGLLVLFGAGLSGVRVLEQPLEEEGEPDPEYVELPNPAFPSPLVHAVSIDRGPLISKEDFAGYFEKGPALEARRAFFEGRYQEAAARWPADDRPQVAFMRALTALKLSDFSTAAKGFEALAPRYPVMVDRCWFFAGQAAEGANDFASAERAYARVPAWSRLGVDATLGLGRVARARKQWDRVGAVLQAIAAKPAPPWGRDAAAEALTILADAAADHGDARGEKDALTRIVALHALSLQARAAEQRLGDLSALSVEWKIQRAETLLEAHHNDEALRLLSTVLPGLALPSPWACRAHLANGKGLRKTRKHAQAILALTPVARQCTETDIRAKALYTLGFSQSVVVPEQAIATYDELVQSLPAHPFADDALLSSFEALMKLGREGEARSRLAQIRERYPDGDAVAEAMFRTFWLAWRARAHDAALKAAEDIERRFLASEDSYELERASYWKARVLEAQGKKDAAVALWSALAVDHHASFYGLSARQRLIAVAPAVAAALEKKILPPEKRKDVLPLYAGPLGKDPLFKTSLELIRLGFRVEVPLEVLAIDRTGLTTEGIRLLVMVLSYSEDQRAAHGLARLWLRRDLSGRITEETRALWEIAYPPAFRDLVEKAAASTRGLDPDLLQALMREESALDPNARSWAGALGLTQLMPSTAAMVAAELKMKRPSTAQIMDPATNLRLGATYLSGLVRRFNGALHSAVGSYNAGPGAITRWWSARPDAPVDEWVEEIPLTETRGYVKRVLRTYNTYKLLRGGVVGEFSKTP